MAEAAFTAVESLQPGPGVAPAVREDLREQLREVGAALCEGGEEQHAAHVTHPDALPADGSDLHVDSDAADESLYSGP